MTDEITITEDGRTMHGSTWIKPQDFATEEVHVATWPLKGCTPERTLDAAARRPFHLPTTARFSPHRPRQ